MRFAVLPFVVLLFLSLNLFSQEIKQNTRIVNVGEPAKFWVEGAKEGPKWELFVARDNGKEKKTDSNEQVFSYTPDDAGSFEVVAKVDGKSLTTYFEAIRVSEISFERKTQDGWSAVIDGEVEKNIVAVGDTVRCKFTSTPQVVSSGLRWLEDGKEIGSGGGLEKRFENAGRFKVEVDVAGATSRPVSITVINNFKITSVKNKDGIDVSNIPVTLGDHIAYSCVLEPADFSPKDISWELVKGSKAHTISLGLIGSGTVDEVGVVSLVARAGAVSTAPKALAVIGAGFINSEMLPQSYLVISKFESAFEKDGSLKSGFIESDADRFYVEITGEAGDYIELRATLDNSVLTDWTKFPLTLLEGKYRAGPFILVSDDVDRVDARAVKAALGGRVEARLKGVSTGSIGVGAKPDEISENAIRTVDVNVFALRGQDTKVVQTYIKVVNERWAQANIRFNVKAVKVVDPPSNMLVVSGKANGIAESGAKGFVRFFLNNIEIGTKTYFGDSARKTAETLISQVPREFNVRLLGGFAIGDEQDFAFAINGGDVKLDKSLTDTGQNIMLGMIDLSGGITLGFSQNELSIDELTLALITDGNPTTINIIIANKLERHGAGILGRAYPEGLFNENLAKTILLSSTLGDGLSCPFFLSKMFGQILLKTTDLIDEPTNIMWQGESRENKVNSAKRLTLEQIKKIRQIHDYKMPSLLQRK